MRRMQTRYLNLYENVLVIFVLNIALIPWMLFWKLRFSALHTMHSVFMFCFLQVMKALIDLEALQPTGDLSPVRILMGRKVTEVSNIL